MRFPGILGLPRTGVWVPIAAVLQPGARRQPLAGSSHSLCNMARVAPSPVAFCHGTLHHVVHGSGTRHDGPPAAPAQRAVFAREQCPRDRKGPYSALRRDHPRPGGRGGAGAENRGARAGLRGGPRGRFRNAGTCHPCQWAGDAVGCRRSCRGGGGGGGRTPGAEDRQRGRRRPLTPPRCRRPCRSG